MLAPSRALGIPAEDRPHVTIDDTVQALCLGWLLSLPTERGGQLRRRVRTQKRTRQGTREPALHLGTQ